MLKWTIRRKLLLFCMLLLLVPTIFLAYNSYRLAKEETDALIKDNLENGVNLMVQNVNQLSAMVSKNQLTLEQAQEEAKILMLGALQSDGTRPINDNIDLGENGYYYVISDKGDLIAHPSLEGQNVWDRKTTDGFYYIQDVIKHGLSGGGFSYYDWPLPNSTKEALKITYAAVVDDWNWIIAAGSYYQDYNQGQQRILYSTITTLVICTVIGALGVILFSNHIVRPIIKTANQARKVATGDLTSDSLVIKNKDEIGSLARDFNTMSDYLKSLVKELIQSSDKVSSASQTLQSSIDETTQASRHIADSTQQIVAGIEMQAASSEQSAKAMEEMATGIQRIAETSSQAYDTSARSKDEAVQGHQFVGQVIINMHSVQQTIGKIEEVMNTLNARSNEISGIVTVMTDIADQTSLLALNASIEAARAGEQGRGFAVVASEVRKLAEMSRASSEQINELVHQVQSDIATASHSTEVGINEFAQGMLTIEQSGAVFDRIVQAIEQVVGQIQEASAAAQQMSAGSEEINASLQELDRIANKNAESSELISAATEEQIATMEEIANSSNQLNRMATELKDMSHRFTIKE